MVNKDDQISYLRDAIYHVTKSKNS